MSDQPQTDEELRLECARLVMAFSRTDDPVSEAAKLFSFIKQDRQQEPQEWR